MLRISREVDLGLLLLVELARSNELVGLKEWAEKRGLPYRYLSKVAVRLKKAGLLKSKEGREGGYSLGKMAKQIKIGEVIEVLEGPIAPVSCMRGMKCACSDYCGHKSLMVKLAEVVEKQLGEVSLEDLC
jgi:Rrf2 family protein